MVSKGAAKITLGGKIIVRGWYFDNISSQGYGLNDDDVAVNTGGLPVKTGSLAAYSTNAYLTVDAKIGDNVQGFMELETSGGESNKSGVYFWGTYDTKPNTEMKFRQLWLQYTGSGLLGAPAGIKAGHMPIVLGEMQFLRNDRFGDDAILAWVDPMKELHLLIGTTKLNEGDITESKDDLNGYVALMTYMLDKDNTIGINYLLAHSDGNLPSFYALDFDTDIISPVIPGCDTLNFQNVGVHGNGKIAGVTYAAEVDFQFGKAEAVGFADDADTNPDAKFKGWGVFAKLGYMLDPVNIRASFAMGSGDDDAYDNDIEEFQTLQGTDATSSITIFPHYTMLYERAVRTAAVSAIVSTYPGGNIRSTGIANTTYYNLGFDVSPIKEVTVSLDGFLLFATETGAWKDIVENETGERVSVDDSLGWEIDAKMNWKLAKNLTYFVEAGMFKPGDFYKDIFESGADETATTAVHGLLLTF
ncbi:MAG: hypothetical protein E4H45_02355 [Nitrospirales bacterium]|nr:MAG: hypothetical protein E4H45_02355 [Nitrospirales bacterium]